MAKIRSNFARIAITCIFLGLAACGGGDDEGDGGGNDTPPPQSGIGAAGGSVSGPGGSSVTVPAGALTASVNIQVQQSEAGSPALPAGFTAVGSMFAFTPHGTAFAAPVTITLPFDASSVPPGSTPALYKTNAQSQWEPVDGATFGNGAVTAQVASFSHAQVVIPKLARNEPTRAWEFGAFPGHGGAEIDFGSGTQVGGVLDQTVEFGEEPSEVDLFGPAGVVPANGKAHGHVFGTEDGVTYGAYAEAPYARIGGSEPIGGISHLTQSQSFIKRSPEARLELTLTKVILSMTDYNLFAPSVGHPDTTLTARVYFEARAYTLAQRTFFLTAGSAMRKGVRPFFSDVVWNHRYSVTPLWSDANFDFMGGEISSPNFAHCLGHTATMFLREPITLVVDLSSIALGEEFTLQSRIFASAENRRGGGSAGDCEGSAVLAYLRDPLDAGGTTLAFSGLEPTNRPVLTPPPLEVVEPASCEPGPEPAGEIQFSSAGFEVGENAAAIPTVRVTRSGGTQGAITATFSTAAGTAVAGADFTPEIATVHFADGDDAPRVIEVPIVADSLDEPDETVNLSLSQPGGCAVLGAQDTALLTIKDDDLPPPTGAPGALDSSFGAAGEVTLPGFGGDRSAMALQADGKIVMVGGTFTDFVLARFNADGSLDSSFDADGRVTTDIQNGVQEEALAVAIQPDGKIVVGGYSGTARAARFALARYHSDGSLDTEFGAQGKVVSEVVGVAYAIAIQPDGKLLLVGDTPRQDNDDFADFMLARFTSDGDLDTTFASSGTRLTDIGGGTNTARNVVLQPDGSIIVSGEPIGTFTGSDHTDIARYDSSGNLDGTFGTDGTLTLGGSRVGEGLAASADGKLILVGSAELGGGATTASQFLVRRLNADGTNDTSFGGTGSVVTTISDAGDAALAVALQQDGKILVAGRSSLQTNSNFAVTRYLVDGALDTTFANAGKQTVDFFGFNDVAESIAVQPDGRIVLGGLARDQVDGYGIARINP
jgi:uncharacterized delta-60 repeat protein